MCIQVPEEARDVIRSGDGVTGSYEPCCGHWTEHGCSGRAVSTSDPCTIAKAHIKILPIERACLSNF